MNIDSISFDLENSSYSPINDIDQEQEENPNICKNCELEILCSECEHGVDVDYRNIKKIDVFETLGNILKP